MDYPWLQPRGVIDNDLSSILRIFITFSPMSPIIIFAFNRPVTTEKLLASLIRCKECADSELYVFIDGPRHDTDQNNVERTIALFNNRDEFGKKIVNISERNKGLAASIIDGVSEVMKTHDSAIVLEDDLVVTHDFLRFMNNALEAYRDRQDIWSISGYTPDIDIPESYEHDLFLVPRAQSWGWATWRNRWEQADWDVKDFDSIANDKHQQEAFNEGGSDLYLTLDMERHHKIESWAVRWAYAGFRHNAYTVNPIASKVRNIGTTYSNAHRGWNDSRHNVVLSPIKITMEPDIQPDDNIIATFKAHHDPGLVSRIGYFLRRHGLGYGFLKEMMRK